MTETSSTEEAYADEIDLSSILAILWKHKKIIIYGTLGATLLSAVVGFLIPPTYRSEGFFQLGNPTKGIIENEKATTKKITPEQKKIPSIGLPVPFYKSSASQFTNPNHLESIAIQHKSFEQEDLEKIATKFRTPDDINKWIKPVYAFAKEDVREFAQLPQDESNSVIGLNLAYESDSPEKVFIYVSFFGKYIRDCLLYSTLNNYIMEGYSKAISQLNKVENDIINMEFELLQNTNKMKDVQAILAKYPEAGKIETRQLVVSIQEGGDRFLAPVTQLIGIESALATLRRDLAEKEREKEQFAIMAEYFSNSHNELKSTGESGELLFLMLKTIRDDVFKNKDLNKDSVKEVFNKLSIELNTFEFVFFKISRFLSGPTVPNTHIRPWRTFIVIASCLGSFLFFIFFVFGLNWWKRNKRNIIVDSSF